MSIRILKFRIKKDQSRLSKLVEFKFFEQIWSKLTFLTIFFYLKWNSIWSKNDVFCLKHANFTQSIFVKFDDQIWSNSILGLKFDLKSKFQIQLFFVEFRIIFIWFQNSSNLCKTGARNELENCDSRLEIFFCNIGLSLQRL